MNKNFTKFAKDFRLWLLKTEQNQGRLGDYVGMFIIKYRQGADGKNEIDCEERADRNAWQSGANNSGVYFLANQNNHVLNETDLKEGWYKYLKNKDNLNKFLTTMASQDGIPVYIYHNQVRQHTYADPCNILYIAE